MAPIRRDFRQWRQDEGAKMKLAMRDRKTAARRRPACAMPPSRGPSHNPILIGQYIDIKCARAPRHRRAPASPAFDLLERAQQSIRRKVTAPDERGVHKNTLPARAYAGRFVQG